MVMWGKGKSEAGGPMLASLVLVLTASWALSGHPGPAHATATRCAVGSTCQIARIRPARCAVASPRCPTLTSSRTRAILTHRHASCALPGSAPATSPLYRGATLRLRVSSRALRTGPAPARARVAGTGCPRACLLLTLLAAVHLLPAMALRAVGPHAKLLRPRFPTKCGRQTGRRRRRGG